VIYSEAITMLRTLSKFATPQERDHRRLGTPSGRKHHRRLGVAPPRRARTILSPTGSWLSHSTPDENARRHRTKFRCSRLSSGSSATCRWRFWNGARALTQALSRPTQEQRRKRFHLHAGYIAQMDKAARNCGDSFYSQTIRSRPTCHRVFESRVAAIRLNDAAQWATPTWRASSAPTDDWRAFSLAGTRTRQAAQLALPHGDAAVSRHPKAAVARRARLCTHNSDDCQGRRRLHIVDWLAVSGEFTARATASTRAAWLQALKRGRIH